MKVLCGLRLGDEDVLPDGGDEVGEPLEEEVDRELGEELGDVVVGGHVVHHGLDFQPVVLGPPDQLLPEKLPLLQRGDVLLGGGVTRGTGLLQVGVRGHHPVPVVGVTGC